MVNSRTRIMFHSSSASSKAKLDIWGPVYFLKFFIFMELKLLDLKIIQGIAKLEKEREITNI